MFFVSAPTINLFGATSVDEQRASELTPFFSRLLNTIPGMFGVSLQASIFEQGLGEGRVVNVDFSGPNLEKLVAAAGTMFGMTMQGVPGSQIRPVPSLELLYPEVRFIPERDRVRAAGLSAQDLGIAIDVILDAGNRRLQGRRPEKVDLVLKDHRRMSPRRRKSTVRSSRLPTAGPCLSVPSPVLSGPTP